MSELPYFPVFVDDVLADVSDFDDAESGAYLLLMLGCWKEGGTLPADQKRLARRAKTEPSRWGAVWAVIGRYFVSDGDRISHPRVTAERARALDMQEARRRGAEKTNAQRGAQRALSDTPSARSTGRSEGRSEGRSRVGIPSPSPSPSPSVDPSLNPTPGEGEGSAPPVPGILLPPFDLFWDRAERGSNPKGTRHEALREWEARGKPDPELLLEQWKAYLASLGDGHSMKVSTWLSQRGWEERWERALTTTERTLKNFTARHEQMFTEGREVAKKTRRETPPRVPCQFHCLTDTKGKRAPNPAPECPECERIWSAQREKHCHLHRDQAARGKVALHHNEGCPECRHVAAISKDPASAGDLVREAEA